MKNTAIGKIVVVPDCAAYRGWSYVKLIFSQKPTFLEVYEALTSLKKKNEEAFEKAMKQSHLRVYSRLDFCLDDRSTLMDVDVKFDYANWLALENIGRKIKG